MSNSGSKIYLYGICGVAVLGGLLFGYDTAVISGGEKALQEFFETGIGKDWYSEGIHGWVVSSALIGCVIGGAISSIMSSKLGRRNSLIVASVLFFLSALGSYFPEFLFRSDFSMYKAEESTKGLMWAFILYRVLGGIGVGLASALSPVYIAEVAPASIRGVLVSWNQFAIIFGQLLVYAINAVIRSTLADNEDEIKKEMVRIGWRKMFVSEAFPAALFCILLFFVPKTPRFLVIKGQEEKAEKVLARINGESEAKSILQDIKDTVEEKKSSLFAFGVVVVLVGILLSFFQQAVGINVVLYYAPRILENMGATGNASMIQTVVMGVVNLVFTVIAILTVEKWGRRPLLMTGSIGMAIGMAALSVIFFAIKEPGLIALVFIIVYTASFMMSWGPMCWVLISEIFPNTIRANAVSIAVAAQWISNLIVSSTFPSLSSWSAGFAYGMYAFFSILSFVFVYFMVPETKGKTLEDIENIWLHRSGKEKANDLV